MGSNRGPGAEQHHSLLTPHTAATATSAEPATHLRHALLQQSDSNYQGSHYNSYCPREASGLSNSDYGTVYCLIKMKHT